MQLPRWLVICLLSASVLAVFAAAGTWWVTWPERTLREFVQLAADGEFEEANRLTTPPTEWVIDSYDLVAPRPQSPDFLGGASIRRVWASRFHALQDSHVKSRTAAELLAGRRVMSFRYETLDGQPREAHIHALRDKVIDMRFEVRP